MGHFGQQVEEFVVDVDRIVYEDRMMIFHIAPYAAKRFEIVDDLRVTNIGRVECKAGRCRVIRILPGRVVGIQYTGDTKGWE